MQSMSSWPYIAAYTRAAKLGTYNLNSIEFRLAALTGLTCYPFEEEVLSWLRFECQVVAGQVPPSKECSEAGHRP